MGGQWGSGVLTIAVALLTLISSLGVIGAHASMSSTTLATPQSGRLPVSPPSVFEAASESLHQAWHHGSAAASQSWSQLTTSAPSSRSDFSMAYDQVDNEVVLFGGYGSSGYLGDTWTFSSGTWTEYCSGCGPGTTPRSGAGMAYDPKGPYILLNGGMASGSSIQSDTWEFTQSGGWSSVSAGSNTGGFCLAHQAMTYDQADGYVLMFGGWGGGAPGTGCTTGAQNWDETRIWFESNSTWWQLCQPCSPSPSARSQAAITYDASDTYVLLDGGDGSGVDGDTWAYRGGTWVQFAFGGSPCGDYGAGQSMCPSGTMPGPRDASKMSFDGSSILFGGCSGPTPNCGGSTTWYGDTWSFSAGVWTQVSTSGPTGRAWEGLAYFNGGSSTGGNNNYILLFGGGGTSYYEDTWAYASALSVTSFSCSPSTLDVGSKLSCSAAPTGGVGNYAYSYSGFDPGCTPPSSSSFSCYPNTPGSFAPKVAVTDSVGNKAGLSASYVVKADPSITASASPLPDDANTKLNFTCTPSGGVSPFTYYWKFGDGTGSAGCDASHAYVSPGTFPACVNVTDSTGVTSATPGCVSVKINPDPSISRFVSSPSTITLGQSAILNVSAAGGTGPLSYSYTGLPPGCATADTPLLSCTPTSATGSPFMIVVTATDSEGQKASKATSLNVSTVPPLTGGLSLSANGTTPGTSVWANATASGGLGPYSYTWTLNGTMPLGTGQFIKYTPQGSGNYTFAVTINDTSGQRITRSALLTVVPQSTYPPISVQISLSSRVVHPGTAIWVNATASGGHGAFSYSWAENGSLYPGAASSVTFTPSGVGNYTFSVSVSDAVGQSTTKSVVLAVVSNSTVLPLTASLTANATTIHVGGTVALTGSVSGGSAPYTYFWTLNDTIDPTLGTSWTISPGFLHAGNYTYQFWVNDSKGDVAASAPITIVVLLPVPTGFQSTQAANAFPLWALLVLVIAVVALLLLVLLLARRRGRREASRTDSPPVMGWVAQPIPPMPPTGYMEGISVAPDEWDESAEPATAYGTYTIDQRDRSGLPGAVRSPGVPPSGMVDATPSPAPSLDAYRPFSMKITSDGIRVEQIPRATAGPNVVDAEYAPISEAIPPSTVRPGGPSTEDVYAVLQSLARMPRSLDGIKQEVRLEDDALFAVLGALTKARLIARGTREESESSVFVLTPLGRKVARRFIGSQEGVGEDREALQTSKPVALPAGKKTVGYHAVRLDKGASLQDVHTVGEERGSLEEENPFRTLRPEDVNPQLKGQRPLPKEVLQPMEMRVQSDRGAEAREAMEAGDSEKRAQSLMERADKDRRPRSKFGVEQAKKNEGEQ